MSNTQHIAGPSAVRAVGSRVLGAIFYPFLSGIDNPFSLLSRVGAQSAVLETFGESRVASGSQNRNGLVRAGLGVLMYNQLVQEKARLLSSGGLGLWRYITLLPGSIPGCANN